MIDPPVSPSERLSDALFQLANAMGRLSDAFELLHVTLIATAGDNASADGLNSSSQ